MKGTGDRMSRRETYEARTEELLLPIVERYGVEIYDVEYVKGFGFSMDLRIMLTTIPKILSKEGVATGNGTKKE